MPIAVTSAKGVVGLALESNPGEQLLLAATAGAATITGISAPPGPAATGGKLHIILTNWTASGTLTITGVGTPNNTETVNVAAPTAQQTQSSALASFDYVSINNYTAITNITTTGGCSSSSATYVVKGIPGSKFNIPTLSFVSDRKVPPYSPNAHTGYMARDTRVTATMNETSISAFDTDLYGDLSIWWPYMVIGYVTNSAASIPASPTLLLATTAMTSSPISLTTQPTAPAMKLILTITGYTSTAVTITIAGTSYGLSVSETISVNANGTYYSANVYSAVTNLTTSTNSSGASVAVGGVFGWSLTFNEEYARYSAAIEHYDGSGSFTHPFSVVDSADATITFKNNTKLTAKMTAQDKLLIGDRTTNPLQSSRVTSIAGPLGDIPINGWQTNVYIDAITGTAKTTLYTDPEETIKITATTKTEAHYTFGNTQNFSRAYQMKPAFTVDLSTDIINALQTEQYRQNLKQYLVVEQRGRQLGTTGGTTYYEGWVWTLPVKYDTYGQQGDPAKGNTYAKPKLMTEYDPGIGASIQLVCYTQSPPTYTL